ncbi:tRNA-specific 2-thiouridylase MnmA [Planctomycetes bacterium Pan216]|uniref:tRNA-specific 2-thiouridylase MnmA n=1 Tax=Kolteria novifilia TaxID=2527975 RepID=A0A518B819_9BACT|nr:tRNA-specific 2-thiouridylase MnmA [Planctomycetes bacterium Pan216]
MAKDRVVVAMSGGVDSSVAAALLVEQGYEVIGLFMRTGASDEETAAPSCDDQPKKIRGCCSAIDAGDAQRVADRLDVPFYALNFKDDFDRIKDYFVDEYSQGRTPNPCVVCNSWLKFGKLWEYAEAVGANQIATGHYARVVPGENGPELHRAVDTSKDQSYFLFGLRQEILRGVRFPLGDLTKPEVREIARKLELGVHTKPESQEICFVPSGDYKEFIAGHRPDALGTPGEIVDQDGQSLGTHQGLSRYTIGQRKGLGIAVGEPRYVLEIDPQQNQLVIGPEQLLQRREFQVERVNWLISEVPQAPLVCDVKIRYLHRPATATIRALPDGCASVCYDEPQSAITPGQAAVFYQGDRLVGGGWIADR